MMKNLPLTTLLLTYLFVCGSLYLIGYWSTFDVDVFSLISLYDIPKNFVYPLMLSQVAYIVNMITGQYFYQNAFMDGKEDNDHFITLDENWSDKKYKIIGLLTSISLWVTISVILLPLFFEKPYQNTTYWTLLSVILSYFLMYKFVTWSIVKSHLKNNFLRFYVGHFVTFFPIACFICGKILSIDIYNNRNVKYFDLIDSKNKKQINNTESMKFLGFVSDKYIYSSIDNQNVFILSKEACDGVVVSKNNNIVTKNSLNK